MSVRYMCVSYTSIYRTTQQHRYTPIIWLWCLLSMIDLWDWLSCMFVLLVLWDAHDILSLLSLAGARWWICASGSSGAGHLRTSFDTTGMQDPRTGWTTTQNTTQTPAMKPTNTLMQAYGIGWTHESYLLARPLAPRFPLTGFPFHFFFIYLILPHLGCCHKGVKIPWF